jgi:hypothetical protein
LEGLGVDGRIILQVVKNLNWINPIRDRDKWWALVNTVMNLRVPSIAGNFLISGRAVSLSRKTMLRRFGLISSRITGFRIQELYARESSVPA